MEKIYGFKENGSKVEVPSLNNSYDIPTIMIGDSYGVGYLSGGTIGIGWCDYLKEYLSLSNNNYHKLVEGALGFTKAGQGGSLNFLDKLQKYESSIENKAEIKSIIVGGGCNDIYCSSTNSFDEVYEITLNKIIEFIEYCQFTYPNATIYIGCIGNYAGAYNSYPGPTNKLLMAAGVLPAYKHSVLYGARYLNGIERVLKNYEYMGIDNCHPTQNGYKLLASEIAQAYIQGESTYIDNSWSLMEYDDDTISNTVKLYSFQNSGQITLFGGYTTSIIYNTPRESLNAGNIILINNVKFNHYRPANIYLTFSHTPLVFVTSDNKYYEAMGMIFVDDNGHLTAQVLSGGENTGFKLSDISGKITRIDIYGFKSNIPIEYA